MKPALGPETDFVALDAADGGRSSASRSRTTRPSSTRSCASDEPLGPRRSTAGSRSRTPRQTSTSSSRRRGGHARRTALPEGQRRGGRRRHRDRLRRGSALDSTPLAGLFGSDPQSLAFSLDPQEDGIHIEGAASPATGDLFSDEFSASCRARCRAAPSSTRARTTSSASWELRDALAEVRPGSSATSAAPRPRSASRWTRTCSRSSPPSRRCTSVRASRSRR